MRQNKILFMALFALITSQSIGQYSKENLKIKELEERSDNMSDPTSFDLRYTHENLRLYPIIANETFFKEHEDIGKFTLLKDAISQDKIAITETGARELANPENNERQRNVGGTVNTLFAKNNSSDTIFIMSGEVVKGGKQDRVIGQDVVIAPGQEVDLSAFCVEKSRWQTKDNNGGKFTGYYNVSSMDIRKTVAKEKDQGEVWRKVDEHTSINGASSETHTYTNLENSKAYQEKVQTYLEKFKDAFSDDQRIIGVVAVTGNKIMGCDMFATHELFIESYQNLIHSYVGQAVTHGAPVTISNEEVFNYLDTIIRDEEQQKEEIEKKGTLYEYDNKKIHISTF